MISQRQEIEAVKRERENLMGSLGALRTDTGKAGGELQQDDIAHLRRDQELKLKKLNELRQVGPWPWGLMLCSMLHLSTRTDVRACKCADEMSMLTNAARQLLLAAASFSFPRTLRCSVLRCLQHLASRHVAHRHVCTPSQESQRLDTEITRLSTTARDCGLLMPDGSPDQQARIAALTATLRRVEADNSDAEAKNQLYLLLRERTR